MHGFMQSKNATEHCTTRNTNNHNLINVKSCASKLEKESPSTSDNYVHVCGGQRRRIISYTFLMYAFLSFILCSFVMVSGWFMYDGIPTWNDMYSIIIFTVYTSILHLLQQLAWYAQSSKQFSMFFFKQMRKKQKSWERMTLISLFFS